MTISIPKDSIPKFLQSYVAYQFTCAGSNACYIGETRSHLKTRIEEVLGKDKNSQILKYLQENPHCWQFSNFYCFDVIHRDTSHFRLQLKEAMHISWKKPILNKQIKHFTLTISLKRQLSFELHLFWHFMEIAIGIKFDVLGLWSSGCLKNLVK